MHLHSPSENGIELLTASRDLEHTLSLLTKLMSSLEAATGRLRDASVVLRVNRSVSGTHLAFDDGILHLVDLDLTEALDFQQIATRSRMH
jgi:hypothetical protein